MAKRKKVDWEAVKPEYRAGQLSNVALAEKYGCTETAIRKKAKRAGWQKDLSQKVREKVREKLVRTEVRTDNANDDQIIEEAAERGANVLRTHRRDINTFRAMVITLLEELKALTSNREDIEDLAQDIAMFKKKQGDALSADHIQKKYTAIMKAVSLPERSKVIQNLCNCLSRLVPLERQAFNLDEGDSGDDLFTSIIKEIWKRNKPLVTDDDSSSH
jgi:hypothetical protein